MTALQLSAQREIEKLRQEIAQKEAEAAEALKDFHSVADLKRCIDEAKEKYNALLYNMLNDKKQYEKTRDDAAADMEIYDKTGNVAKYLKAKRDYEDSKIAVEMLTAHINSIEKRPMIEREEYLSALADVKSEFDPEIEKAHTELKEHLLECCNIVKRLNSQLYGVNNALTTWQRYIYRDRNPNCVAYDDESCLTERIESRLNQILNAL